MTGDNQDTSDKRDRTPVTSTVASATQRVISITPNKYGKRRAEESGGIDHGTKPADHRQFERFAVFVTDKTDFIFKGNF
jgi:hypothetical protein